MKTTREIADYLDALLDIANVPDYPNALNGLQLDNTGNVSRVAACVDFSMRGIDLAIREKADLLLIHHGMFWGGLRPFTSVAYSRLKALIDNDIAVYSAHLPLDRHPTFGNNVLLSRQLGLTPSGEFASYKGASIGVKGTADLPTQVLIDRAASFASANGGHLVSTGISPDRMTRQWAVCTGAGASSDTLREAESLGIDTLIAGEGPHHTAVEADELNIAVLYAGHYATETLGVKALAQHLAERFSLEWTMIHAPTGL